MKQKFTHFFWMGARVNTIIEYEEDIAHMRTINSATSDGLLETAKPNSWATTYFHCESFGHYTSNITKFLTLSY